MNFFVKTRNKDDKDIELLQTVEILAPTLSQGKNQRRKRTAYDKIKITESDDSLFYWLFCKNISKSVADFEKLYYEWKASDVWRYYICELASIPEKKA